MNFTMIKTKYAHFAINLHFTSTFNYFNKRKNNGKPVYVKNR